ncbi:hypothetical protein MBLNU459_g3362t1 [Dothideomycetes sp. NU459]
MSGINLKIGRNQEPRQVVYQQAAPTFQPQDPGQAVFPPPQADDFALDASASLPWHEPAPSFPSMANDRLVGTNDAAYQVPTDSTYWWPGPQPVIETIDP